MNYRHAFHAGNFADVFKHVLLTRLLAYLMRKDAALRYVDTHAGIGFYDLGDARAERTGEWRGGIGALASALPQASPQVMDLLKPYLDCLGPLDAQGMPNLYPGSPAIAQHMSRKQDRLTLCELHAEDVKALKANIGRDKRAKVIAIDGYVALKAYVPPRERRGLVLIDPPFEDAREFERLASALPRAVEKWPTGTYALWHPV